MSRKIAPKSNNNSAQRSGTTKTKKQVVAANKMVFPLWMKLCLALISLFLGLITPPLLVRAEVAAAAAEETQGGMEQPVCTAQDGSCPQTESPPPEPSLDAPLFPCTNATLNNYLHENPVPGYHVVCFQTIHNEKKVAKDFLRITYYKEGFWNLTTTQTFPAPYQWKFIKVAMERQFKLSMKKQLGAYQPWAVFTPLGQRVVDADLDDPANEDLVLQVMVRYGTLLVYEGGQFIWPGIHIGFQRHVNLYSVMPMGDPVDADRHQIVNLRTLSLDPLVFSVDEFLTEEECDHIQARAEPTLQYSGVVLMDKDKGRPASDFRTSQSTFVSSNNDDILLDIEYRTASLVRVPRQHQEDVQVLRYGQGEKYDHHHDFFNPSLYKNDLNTLNLIQHGKRNRLATVFWYLSDVEAGGETAFPRFMGSEPKTMQDCETGLLVRPKRGKVIIFYSLKMSGETDDRSLHGACPVKEGVKYAGNKWVWNEPMPYVTAME